MHDFMTSCHLISPLQSSEGSGSYLQQGGLEVAPELVEEIRTFVSNLLTNCMQFYYVIENGNKIPKTVGDYISSEFNKYLQFCRQDSASLTKLKREIFDWILRFEVIDNSCDSLNDLSARLWGQFGDPGSEQDHINLTGGFSSLVSCLLEGLPNGSVRTSCPVSSIKWDQSNCEVSCDGGARFLTDYVIVTCSVGYLKKNLNIFEPPLPLSYQKAISSIGFGTINKIFLFYDEPWWKHKQGIQLVWDSRNDVLSFQTEEMSWIRGLTGFDPVATCNNVLLGWVGGTGAVECEKLSDVQIMDHCTTVIRHFSGCPDVAFPCSVLRTKWSSNGFVCGAYSHLTPDSANCHPHPQEILTSPLRSAENNNKQRPVLLFAGEALHKKYYSTANGAFDSGEAQALKVLKYMKVGENC